jgi:hypothetical protein
MTYDEVKSLLGNISAWDVDSGPRGEEKRRAIGIAIRAIEFCEMFFDLMKEFSDEYEEHHTEES